MSDIIELEVNGIRYSGWTDVSASKSIESLAGQFRFSTTVKQTEAGIIQNDLKVQDEVKVYVGDVKFLTGFIEDLTVEYSADSHSITVAGRDKLADLIDSSIIQKQYKQTNFIKLVRAVLKDNGYTDIKVIDNAKDILGATVSLAVNDSVIKTEKGDSIADFLDRYAKKLQILITSDEDGNMVMTREGDELSLGSLISTSQKQNVLPVNILSASVNINTVDRYKFIEMYSQSDNTSFTVNTVKQSGIAIDDTIRGPRRKRMTLGSSTSTNSLTSLAKWSVNIRKAKGLRYNCRVQGVFSAGDFIWKSNTLVQIKDDRCQLNGQFLIQGVTFGRSVQGTFTDISVVQKGAFSVEGESASDGSNFASDLINTKP